MLIYEYKLGGNKQQYQAIDEAIRVTQFIGNKCLRKWMDERGVSHHDLQCYCAELTHEYSFAACLNSQPRQAAADRRVEHCNTGKQLGIDVGLQAYYTDSEGETIENPRFYRKAERKLKRLHRQLSRKQKQSKNRKKARKQLAKAFLKVQRQREDFARKTASTLITSSDLIAYEDLQIRNMVKNRHLAKSIQDAGWGIFLQWVNYYGSLHGVSVIKVVPHFTSQSCSACGTLVKKSLSVRTHICHGCGVVLDRDHNAALNILTKALGCTVGHPGTDGLAP